MDLGAVERKRLEETRDSGGGVNVNGGGNDWWRRRQRRALVDARADNAVERLV